MISVNSKQNVTFKGIAEDVAVSRQIVRNIRTEFGRPHSDTFVGLRCLQNKDNPKFKEILDKLDVVRKKYEKQIDNLRAEFLTWYVPQRNTVELPEYIEKSKQLMHKYNAADCGEMAEIAQFEHLRKGIVTNNIQFIITGTPMRNHVFSLRNMPEKARFEYPKTWGEAILVDSHSGSGIVGQAVMPEGSGKKGALKELLEYFCFNPKKESVRFFNNDSLQAMYYIEDMKNGIKKRKSRVI